MARCIALDMDCADMCRLASAYMARGSELAAAISEVCADICEECGNYEREEEEIIFPAPSRPRELNMLTEVLRGQHAVARGLTARIGLEIADPGRIRQLGRPTRDRYNRVLDRVQDALGIGLAQFTATPPKPRPSQ